MSKLRVHNLVVSLDGFATGEGQSLDAAFGYAQHPPFRAPCFVMTHYEREPLTVSDTTLHFVSATPAEVLKQAQKAAGELDIRLGGGPTTINEFLQADLVYYLHIVLVTDRPRPRRATLGRPRRAA